VPSVKLSQVESVTGPIGYKTHFIPFSVSRHADGRWKCLNWGIVPGSSLSLSLDSTMNTHANRFNSDNGLSVNIAAGDTENLQRIRFILDQWEAGATIERSSRTSDEWQTVEYFGDLLDFQHNRYRRAQ